MPYPPIYDVTYSYTAFQAAQGDNSFPGTQLDADLAGLQDSLDNLSTFMQNVQRSDGALKNGVVTYDSLAPALQTAGIAPADAWVTATYYAENETAVTAGALYRALVAHTSGVFATDLAAGKWLFITNIAAVKPHAVTFTVAPFGATANDKANADFVCDGVNDQVAITAAMTAGGMANMKVVCLPGAYYFSSTLNVNYGNNFHLDAEGTVIFGPTGALDTVKITNPANGSQIKFGTILHQSTDNNTSAIHVVGNAALTNNACINAFISFGKLKGTTHHSNGLRLNAVLGGVVVSKMSGGFIETFNRGVWCDAAGSVVAWIDTVVFDITFIYDNNVNIYGRSGTLRRNNANVWKTNVDSYIDGAVAIDIDHSFDIFDNLRWGVQAPSPATTKLLWLRAGATGNIFNGVPPLFGVFGAGYVQDDSGNTSNSLNVQASLDAVLNGNGQLVKLGGAADGGQLLRTGISFGTIGTAKTIPWFSALGVMSSLATANSGVLVTDSGGTPLISGTLPAGIAATGMLLTTAKVQAGVSTIGGALGLNAGTLNFGDGAANRTLVSTDQAQTLSNKTFGDVSGTFKLTQAFGHSIGAASPGNGWGLYHAGTINAAAGFAINWQTDATLVATANGNTLQGMRITSTITKGAFTGVLSYGLYIAGGAALAFDYGIYVADASPSQFGGRVVSVHPTEGLGYATGAGGTVTQATSKATGVTLNKVCGAITLNNANLAAGAVVSFVLTNSAIAATDVLVLNMSGGSVPAGYLLNARCAAGSATIDVRNVTAGGIAEAFVIQFAVIKGVNA